MPCRSLVAALLSMLLVVSVVPSTASAVPPRSGGGASAESAGAAWHALFEQGRQAHDAGQYEQAADAFRRAREAGGPVSLLYNEALCLDHLGRYDEALTAYQSYLAASPAAANRAEVEARISALQPADIESGGSGMASRIAPPSGLVMQIMPLEAGFETVVVGQGRPVAQLHSSGDVEEIGPEWVVSWFFLVGTLGSMAGAIAVWADGQSTFNLLREDCAAVGGCSEADIAASSAHTSATVTNVLVVTTAVLGLATAISFLVEGTTTGGTRVYVDLSPGGVALRGTF